MVEEKTLREKILTNKILPILLMGLNLALFFYIIPDHISERFGTFFAIFGGVITLILSFWIVGTLLPKLFETIPVLTGLLCISTLFIFGYFHIVKTVDYSSDELAKYGVYTEAVIIDKTKIYGKRGRSIKSMEVRFVAKDNKTYNASIDLTDREYNSFREGMTIPIKYSSKHPNIARIDYNRLRR